MEEKAKIEEVLDAERAWLEAHRQLDVNALTQLMAEEYTIIRPDGQVVGKQEALGSYRSQTRGWVFAASDEYHVRVYGDAAVVIGRWRAKGKNTGETFDYAARYTSVWVKRGERWQMVSDQSTPIAD